MKEPKGWYRTNLPHFDAGDVCQFITFRLVDTVAVSTILAWENELSSCPTDERAIEIEKRYQRWLDRGYGRCWLAEPSVALIVQNALLYFHESRYRLHSWVIMPNHVHILIEPIIGHSLPSIIHSLRSYTSLKSNGELNRSGAFWQREYFDRYIRNEKHYLYTVHYIEENPVRAGLCESKEKWIYSSAYKNPCG